MILEKGMMVLLILFTEDNIEKDMIYHVFLIFI